MCDQKSSGFIMDAENGIVHIVETIKVKHGWKSWIFIRTTLEMFHC